MQAEGFAVEIAGLAEAHALSANERARLIRAVTGAVPGNRDRPVFALAARLSSAGIRDPLNVILPGQGVLGRLDTAFLDFLVTAAVADPQDLDRLLAAFDDASRQADPARALASALGRVLHGYRTRTLPYARAHNVFTAIRRFYAQHRPQAPEPRDGDALAFWEAEATRAFLTRHVTALNGLGDYAEAARLAAGWRFGVSLEDAGARGLTEDAGAEMADDDPLASERLEASCAALSAAPVKLLLAREIEEIAALAAIAAPARRWPQELMAALAFGPVQNAITEALRRSGPLDPAEQLERAERYADLCRRHVLLSDKLMDALHLIHLVTLPEPESAAARSSLSPERRKRINAMERRRSLSAMDAESRRAALQPLIAPLLTLRALLEAVCAALQTPSDAARAAIENDHRARFGTKLAALYAAQEIAQETGVVR